MSITKTILSLKTPISIFFLQLFTRWPTYLYNIIFFKKDRNMIVIIDSNNFLIFFLDIFC